MPHNTSPTLAGCHTPAPGSPIKPAKTNNGWHRRGDWTAGITSGTIILLARACFKRSCHQASAQTQTNTFGFPAFWVAKRPNHTQKKTHTRTIIQRVPTSAAPVLGRKAAKCGFTSWWRAATVKSFAACDFETGLPDDGAWRLLLTVEKWDHYPQSSRGNFHFHSFQRSFFLENHQKPWGNGLFGKERWLK